MKKTKKQTNNVVYNTQQNNKNKQQTRFMNNTKQH